MQVSISPKHKERVVFESWLTAEAKKIASPPSLAPIYLLTFGTFFFFLNCSDGIEKGVCFA